MQLCLYDIYWQIYATILEAVVLLLGQVESCSVSISAISALFSPETGGWMIRLGWSEMNPKCDMRLDELVIEGEPFETVETQTCEYMVRYVI